MPAPRRFALDVPRFRAARALFVVIGLGALLRVANLIDLGDAPFFTRPVIDGQVYDRLARAICAGNPPSGPFYQDPLYPYFLAASYAVFGHSFWAVYVLQLLLGLLLLFLVYDTTRLVFDPRAGVAAALLAALYGPFIFYESQIEKTGLAVFLVGLLLWSYSKALRHGHWVWPLTSGLALGLSVLTRANMTVFAPVLPLALALERRPTLGQSAARRTGILALIGILAILLPVVLRNSLVGHEFLLTTTQGGQNFFIGNSPYNLTGQYVAPPWVRPHPDFEQQDLQEYADKAAGRHLSSAETSRFYFRLAFDWATKYPQRFFGLLGLKTLLYFNGYEIPDNQDVYFFARYSWVQRLPLIGFGLVFGLALAGMVLLTRRLSRWSLVVFYFGYAASVIAFFVFSRYRLPAVPALLPFAGGMLVWLWDRLVAILRSELQSRRPIGQLLGGLVLVAGATGLTAYPIHKRTTFEAAQCLVNLASSYWHEGDTVQAIATFEEALKTRPLHGEALRNLGIIRYEQGRLDLALDYLKAASRAEPTNAVTHYYLGKVYQGLQQLGPAHDEYRTAVKLAPGRVEYRF
ncbi:MAG: glycosyltransferase family 39 protein, partial [candidate division WOR-3 bacterium]